MGTRAFLIQRTVPRPCEGPRSSVLPRLIPLQHKNRRPTLNVRPFALGDCLGLAMARPFLVTRRV